MLYQGLCTFVLIACTLLVGCKQTMEPDSTLPVANAGPNQTSQVGSYVVLDASQSIPGESGKIVWYEWQQDENNPVQFRLLSGETDTTQTLGFTEDGIYKFYLVVRNGAQTSQPDEVRVTVKPRDDFNFADANLEISVRYSLKMPEQELTDDVLVTLDSLRSPWFVCVNDLNGIQKCANLKGLYMSLQQISDISPLSNLRKLVWLELDQNYRIKDVSPLAGLTQLQHLNLDSNEITDISPLANLTELTYLNVMWSPINDVSIVANMKDLEQLWLSHSPIGTISPVAELNKLFLLWLAKCEITDINPIENLINLHLLFLENNSVSDVSPLAQLVNLERLYLDHNQIVDISAIENLTQLQLLGLGHNQINDILALVKNSGLNNGDVVGLRANPLNEISINQYIPELRARGVIVIWP